MRQYSIDQIEAMLSQGQTLWVRWTRTPSADCRRGHSLNHQTGRAEGGISVNPLNCAEWWAVNGRTVREWIEMQVNDYAYIPGKPYLLSGEQCGTGSDNEPVICNAKCLGAIDI